MPEGRLELHFGGAGGSGRQTVCAANGRRSGENPGGQTMSGSGKMIGPLRFTFCKDGGSSWRLRSIKVLSC